MVWANRDEHPGAAEAGDGRAAGWELHQAQVSERLGVRGSAGRNRLALCRLGGKSSLRSRHLNLPHGDNQAARLSCCQIANAHIEPTAAAVLDNVHRQLRSNRGRLRFGGR